MTTQEPESSQALPKTSFIFSVTEYLDDVGRRVVHRQVVSGVKPSDHAEYVGVQQVVIRVPSKGVVQPSTYRFPIEGVRSLEEAFAMWDQLSESFGKIHSAELQKNYAAHGGSGLVVPTPDQARKILTPD